MSNFKYGQKVLVKDFEEKTFTEKYFILEVNGKFLVTSYDYDIEDFEEETSGARWYDECKALPEKKVVPFTYETFKPHRDKWFHFIKNRAELFKPIRVDNEGFVYIDTDTDVYIITWETFFKNCKQEDGSACGVEVEA